MAHWFTPDTLTPDVSHVRRLYIPGDELVLAAVSGALTLLTEAHNWEAYGAASVEDTVAAMSALYEEFTRERLADEVEIQFRQIDPCLAEYSLDDGGTWHTLVDLTVCDIPSVPTGTVLEFAGASAPLGYLLCNGAAVSRATYAVLFDLIGVTYGSGNGSTTFNVPDLRGRAPIGVGSGTGLTPRALAASGGEENHSLTVAELAAHHHIQYVSYNNYVYNAPFTSGDLAQLQAAGNTSDTGGGAVHNNMQPWLAVNFIIKT